MSGWDEASADDRLRREWDEHVAHFWRQRPLLLQCLQRLTAEMMALPQLVCGRRACRRRHGCGFVRPDDMSPWCLGNLDAEKRAGYDRLLDRAMYRFVDLAGPDYATRTELDRAALELERALSPPGDRRIAALNAFWRGKPPLRTRPSTLARERGG